MPQKTETDCAICDGTGWRPVEKGGVRAVEACGCRMQPREESWWLERARIPTRYWQCDFESFYGLNESLQMARLKAQGFVEQYPLVDKGILFLGIPGVGKTHLAVAILRDLMLKKGVDCLFCSFQDLLQQIRESYNPVSSSTESQVLQPVLETEVVVIDDLGANRVTDWVEDTVTYLLNHRYNQKKATLLTSNVPDDAKAVPERSPSGKFRIGDTLEDRIGIRVYSRLFEMCDKVLIQAKDFRQEVHRVHR
jgi:DNA replication protein DnaC